jgi:hypothetical protein
LSAANVPYVRLYVRYVAATKTSENAYIKYLKPGKKNSRALVSGAMVDKASFDFSKLADSWK